MTDYVLIHGAWRGGWVWKRVRDLLTAEGHRVFTPTLTGLGERSHLLTPAVGLDTHVADVVNLIMFEELTDVVLVGHSYSGIVARMVADQIPERIRSLIYVDAFVPDNGKSILDYTPDFAELVYSLAAGEGEGWKVPPLPESAHGPVGPDSDWLTRQSTMHPLSTFEMPASINGACDSVRRIGYILARRDDNPFDQFYARAGERGWWRAEIPSGHSVMTDRPKELTELLLKEA